MPIGDTPVNTLELISLLHGGLGAFVAFLKLALEFISVFCVATGLIISIHMLAGFARKFDRFLEHLPEIRLKFGSWLALALEFQLGADIVATTINPSLEKLGELGLLAIIRTFLNYFLQKELESQERVVRELLRKDSAAVE